LVNHENDGGVGKALQKLRRDLIDMMENNCDYFEDCAPNQPIELIPKPILSCETISYEEGLKEKLMRSRPSFKMTLLDMRNKRNFNAILDQKSDFDILVLKHDLLEYPCINIIAPRVNFNRIIKIKYGDPLLLHKYENALKEIEEYKEKLHDADKKLSNVLMSQNEAEANNIRSKRKNSKKIAKKKNDSSSEEDYVYDNVHKEKGEVKPKKRKVLDESSSQEQSIKKKVKHNHHKKKVENSDTYPEEEEEEKEEITCFICNKTKLPDKFKKKMSPTYTYDFSKRDEPVCVTCYKKRNK
jgi:hypothetical protein